ncbi:MAG: tetratricopeptide repeat protein [Myxococcales bacterium]|nr:tetratricopeptide repeat protein [Myxococcales bacterium]
MRLRAIQRLLWFSSLALLACEAPMDQDSGGFSENYELPDETLASSHGALRADTDSTRDSSGYQSQAVINNISPTSTPDWFHQVRTLIREERYDEARDLLTSAQSKTPNDPTIVLILSGVELLAENYSDAYQIADTFLSEHPQDYPVLKRRAMASLMGHDIETAVVDFQALVVSAERHLTNRTADVCDPLSACCQSMETELAEAKTGLATARYNLGDLDAAERLASDVLNTADDRGVAGAAKFVLALSASKRGKDDTAFSLYQDVLNDYPENPAVLNNIGGVYYRMKDLVRARSFFMKAYETAGVDRRGAAIAWSNVGEVDLLEGKFRDAEDKLLEAIAISPTFAGSYFTLAALYDVLGRVEEAQIHLKRGLELDEQGVVRWNSSYFSEAWEDQLLAMIAEQQGNLQDSLVLWQSVLKSDVDVLKASAHRHIARLTGY